MNSSSNSDMVILGASGFAKQLLSIVLRDPSWGKPVFFDDVTPEDHNDLKEDFEVIRSWDTLRERFEKDPDFVLGTGNPAHRKLLFNKAVTYGGNPASIISPKAIVSGHRTQTGDGVTILDGAVVEGYTHIGSGVLLNLNCCVTHDCTIGDFSELGPMACLLGGVTVGNGVSIGAGAVVMPNITIGDYAVIGAGAVVTRNVAAHTTVAGVPAIPK